MPVDGGEKIFSKTSRGALVFAQLPIKCVMGALSPALKWPGHEAEHPPPSSTEFKNKCRSTSVPRLCDRSVHKE